ncbi:hypothetical protein U9M48_042062 [Paspalum notatum var. saurae]|uniref:Reverse transcriptase domain-containing protein n=1 Tax=Paspalum notatum var. saurae TaxID=547442 RepID=A0AAQ3URV8_PASNO
MKGFSSIWCSWVQAYVQGSNVSIKVNDQLGSFFQTKKGLRQGDPLSPLLFNIVVDMLAIIVSRAKTNGQVKGIVPNLVEDHDMEQAKNMKLILYLFEQLSGLKINFHKNEILCFGQAKEHESYYSNLFGCKIEKFPFHDRRKNRKKDLSNWKGKLLSYGGRLVVLNSILSSLPIFMLSFFEVPKGVLEKIEYFRSRFFWQYDNHKKKYRLIKWPIVCQPKEQGGLGVQNLDIMLRKWLFKLCNEDGIWQELLRNKFLKGKSLSQTNKKAKNSHFWKSVMGVKDQFLNLGRFKLVSGNQIRFWEDIWLDNQALKDQHPNLFNIVRNKHATVAEVLNSIPLNVSFRRALVGNRLNEWSSLVARLTQVNLQEGKDIFVWRKYIED